MTLYENKFIQSLLDIVNFFRFRKDIKKESNNVRSTHATDLCVAFRNDTLLSYNVMPSDIIALTFEYHKISILSTGAANQYFIKNAPDDFMQRPITLMSGQNVRIGDFLEIIPYTSRFNKLGLRRNMLGNIAYAQINFTEAEADLADYNMSKPIALKMTPMIDYFNDIGWGEYMKYRVENFFDTETQQKTLSWAVIFTYHGYRLSSEQIIRILFFGAGAVAACAIGLLVWLV